MILTDLTLTDEKRFSKLLSANKKDLRQNRKSLIYRFGNEIT